MRHLAVAFGCVAATVAVAVPAVAAADPDPNHPVYIDPNTKYPNNPDPPAGQVPNQLTSPGTSALIGTPTRWEVTLTDSSGGDNGYARARIQAGELVEGNAKTHTTFDKQSVDSSGAWFGGYIYWEIGGCGWLYWQGELSRKSGTPTGACATPSRLRTDVGYRWNARSNCQPDGSCDGEHTAVSCDPVPEYANVRPWSLTPSPQSAIRFIANPGHVWEVYWRYITKESAHAWVMARDPHIAGSDGNWVFIPSSCFAGFGFPKAVAMTNG